MDNNPSGNKRNYGNSPRPNSPRKVQKTEWQKNAPASSSPKKTATVPSNLSKSNSSTTLDNKMNNAAKLRQQFIEEVKDIELSLKVRSDRANSVTKILLNVIPVFTGNNQEL